MNSAVKSLVLAGRQHGVDLSLEKLTQEYEQNETEPSIQKLQKMANENHLKAKKVKSNWDDLKSIGKAYPVIAQLKNKKYTIFVNFQTSGNHEEKLSVIDPLASNPKIEKIDKEKLLQNWDGTLLLLKRNYSLLDEDQPFSMAWVVKELFKQKVLLTQIILIAMVMHVFGFLPIIYIMTVLDKVVNYEAYSTLIAVASGITLAHVFNGIFGYLKKYIGLFVTSKIEAKLSQDAFNSVMDLPLHYFHRNNPSQVINAVKQVESIKKFISNKLFGTLLDATSLFIFIPIMILYSPKLFLVVLVFALMISANNIISSRKQKELIRNMSLSDTQKQSILMNSVSGIETVKSLTLESHQKKQWEEFASQSIKSDMAFWKHSTKSAQISSTLQQVMTVAVIFIGVLLVFSNELSPGVLIGANMLAGKITNPLVQLVTMSTDFKMFEMSITSVASVMNSPKDVKRMGACPAIKGGIEFKDIDFQYKDDVPTLENVSFKIEPRQKVAIVGPSGSGKSTLMRLILGLLRPKSGTILVDGIDLRTMDLAHLRMNISFVEQDNTFFRETIRENITKAMPNAPMDRVEWAARLSDLHREVEDMPDGYETMLDEGGANLSTGQKQKLAVARSLIRNPRILIFDEALSGLGIEDQLSMRNNMDDIRSGRTLLIITPYISQITDCDNILVMDKGQLIEQGNHQSLMQKNGYYAGLYHKERSLHHEGISKPHVQHSTQARA